MTQAEDEVDRAINMILARATPPRPARIVWRPTAPTRVTRLTGLRIVYELLRGHTSRAL